MIKRENRNMAIIRKGNPHFWLYRYWSAALVLWEATPAVQLSLVPTQKVCLMTVKGGRELNTHSFSHKDFLWAMVAA